LGCTVLGNDDIAKKSDTNVTLLAGNSSLMIAARAALRMLCGPVSLYEA
jgi:hypothetical protein